jgi:hypothetical protein
MSKDMRGQLDQHPQGKKKRRNQLLLHMGLLFLVLGLTVSYFSLRTILAHPIATKLVPGHGSHPEHTPNLITAAPPTPIPVLNHLFGGFSIDTPARVTDAASDGVTFTIDYGDPPSPTSAIGQQLLAYHMKVIDGFIASNLYYYECHKSKAITNPSPDVANYCQKDYRPSYASNDILLAAISNHLRAVASNPLVIGYWVLDDQALWDTPGYAKDILTKAHELIQHYTPDRPAICGYGASISANKAYSWYAPLALNFTSEGCDMVGLYIYSDSQPLSTPNINPDTFDWTMSGLLPQIFSSLHAQGWDIKKEPLMGIGQAWAGPRKDVSTDYEVIPSAQNIQTQTLSFCQNGAIAVTYYAWDDSTVPYFPWNTPSMKEGIQQGIAACKRFWHST